MPDSQNPEHVQKLIREFQLKGANLVPTVTAEIVPTVLVADLTAVGPQSQDRLCFGGVLAAASGAGNQNRLAIQNPSGSDTLVVVEAVWFEGAAADWVVPIARAFTFVASGFKGFRDSRLTGSPVGETARGTQAAAVLGAPPIQVQITGTDTTRLIPWQHALAPNTALEFTQQNQNTAINFGVLWRERPLIPGE
jgi:hypothetical protein